MRFFAALASTNAGRKITKRRKKDELSPAIGKNYINKNVSFLPVRVRTQTGLLTFYLCMFLLIANRKESEKIATEKGDSFLIQK